jgi:hypothetical protein
LLFGRNVVEKEFSNIGYWEKGFPEQGAGCMVVTVKSVAEMSRVDNSKRDYLKPTAKRWATQRLENSMCLYGERSSEVNSKKFAFIVCILSIVIVVFVSGAKSETVLNLREIRFQSDFIGYNNNFNLISVTLRNGDNIFFDRLGNIIDTIHIDSGERDFVSIFPRQQVLMHVRNSGQADVSNKARIQNLIGLDSKADVIRIGTHERISSFAFKGDAYDISLDLKGNLIAMTSVLLSDIYIIVIDFRTCKQVLRIPVSTSFWFASVLDNKLYIVDSKKISSFCWFNNEELKRDKIINIDYGWDLEHTYLYYPDGEPLTLILNDKIDTTIGPLVFWKLPEAIRVLDSLKATDVDAKWSDYFDPDGDQIFLNKNGDTLFAIDLKTFRIQKVDIHSIIGQEHKAVIIPLGGDRCFAVPRQNDGKAYSVLIFDLVIK